MTTEDVVRLIREQLPSMPSSDDMLHSVGLQYERGANSAALITVTAFAVGALAGAVLATLFAPKSGQEMRNELNERVRAFGDRMGFSDRSPEDDPATH
jgi:uncharacterized membrane protein